MLSEQWASKVLVDPAGEGAGEPGFDVVLFPSRPWGWLVAI